MTTHEKVTLSRNFAEAIKNLRGRRQIGRNDNNINYIFNLKLIVITLI